MGARASEARDRDADPAGAAPPHRDPTRVLRARRHHALRRRAERLARARAAAPRRAAVPRLALRALRQARALLGRHDEDPEAPRGGEADRARARPERRPRAPGRTDARGPGTPGPRLRV